MENMLGKRIKEQRKLLGLTQDELAKKIGAAGKSTVSQYETGSSNPDYETLKLIAQYFNCPTDYLLGLTDHPKASATKINIMDETYQKYLTDEQSEFMRDKGPVWVTLAAEFENEGLSADEVREIVTTVMKLTKDRQK